MKVVDAIKIIKQESLNKIQESRTPCSTDVVSRAARFELGTAVWIANPAFGIIKGPSINYERVPRKEKSLHTVTLVGEVVKPILTYYFPSRYFILEIARTSGLAGIIFHLRLEGKKRVRMSCFLLVWIYVKLGVLV